MKRLTFGILIGLLLVAAMSVSAGDKTKASSNDDNSLREYYLAVGKFFNVPERAVMTIKKKGVSDEELAVVFFIAERAGIKPAPVMELRDLKKSWLEITVHFGLSPEIYFVPVTVDPGPPYGKAYGYFKNHPREEWKQVKLSDVEIVNLTNLRLFSKLYGISSDEVIKWRAEGKHFSQVNKHAQELRKQQQAEAKSSKQRGAKARAEANENREKKEK
ncbi:MAG: hypothetical protein IPH75_16240 [bacterium]|nr:hypothetical protein [bacterium]